MASRFQVIKCHKWQASRVNKKMYEMAFQQFRPLCLHIVWKSLKKSPFFHFTTLRAKSKTIWIFAPKPQNFCPMRLFWQLSNTVQTFFFWERILCMHFRKRKSVFFLRHFLPYFPASFGLKFLTYFSQNVNVNFHHLQNAKNVFD